MKKPLHKYRIFDNAGLFSEINNALLAIHYAKKLNHHIILFNPKSNFSDDHGWHHLFEATDMFDYNSRTSALNSRGIKPRNPTNGIRGLNRMIFNFRYFATKHLECFRANCEVHYTPATLRDCRNFAQNELRRNKSELIKEIQSIYGQYFQPNNAVITRVSQLKAAFNTEFIAIFIRRGDKIVEAPHHNLRSYIDHIPSELAGLPIFLSSDDTSIYSEITKEYKNLDFVLDKTQTLEGFDYNKFRAKTKESRIDLYQTLLARFELMRHAKLIISTRSCNPGMWLGMMEPEKFIGVDHAQWMIQ